MREISWLTGLLRTPSVARVARLASDYVDLQWSLTIEALERAAPQVHGRLIDVGCGDKPYAHVFAPYVSEYVGVEHEDTFAETSAAARDKADVVYAGDRLPFPDATFESALCVQVLEHTLEPLILLREVARVLKPAGRLIVVAPFSFRLHEEPHDYFRYSPHGLRMLCERAGFEVRSMEPMGSLWTLIGHKLNTFFGLSVARLGGVAQELDKLGHEPADSRPPRLWTLPVVAPAMFGVAATCRLLDDLIPDRTESLSFIAIARRATDA